MGRLTPQRGGSGQGFPGTGQAWRTPQTPTPSCRLAHRGRPRVLSSGGVGRHSAPAVPVSEFRVPCPTTPISAVASEPCPHPPQVPQHRGTRFQGTCQMHHLPKITLSLLSSHQGAQGRPPRPRARLARGPSPTGLQELGPQKGDRPASCVRAHLWTSPGLSLPIRILGPQSQLFIFWTLIPHGRTQRSSPLLPSCAQASRDRILTS